MRGYSERCAGRPATVGRPFLDNRLGTGKEIYHLELFDPEGGPGPGSYMIKGCCLSFGGSVRGRTGGCGLNDRIPGLSWWTKDALAQKVTLAGFRKTLRNAEDWDLKVDFGCSRLDKNQTY